MGGGDLNLKKSWHPHTMKNQEKVWKAEQAKSQEEKKLGDLRKEIEEEKNREELKRIGRESGVLAGCKDGEKKLDWMYKNSAELINREEYLLGRKIDKSFETLQAEEKEKDRNNLVGVKQPLNHVEHECVPFSIRAYKNLENSEQVDLQRKVMEDPLMLIKQREMESRRKILENPVKLKELHRILKTDEKLRKVSKKSKKNEKSKKKLKKRTKSSSSSKSTCDSDSDLDSKLAKKLKGRLLNKDEASSLGINLTKLLDSKFEKISQELDKAAGKNKKRSKKNRSESDDSSTEHNSNRDKIRKGGSKYFAEHRELKNKDRKSDLDSRRRDRRYDRYEQKEFTSSAIKNHSRTRENNIKNSSSPNSGSIEHKRIKQLNRSTNDVDRNARNRSESMSKDKRNMCKGDRKSRSKSRDRIKSYRSRTNSPVQSSSRSRHRPEKVEKSSSSTAKSSSKYTDEEKQAKLREMMSNAAWREEERTEVVRKHREAYSREEQRHATHDFDKDFVNKEVKKAMANQTSVGTRIRANLNNIQRTSAAMNSNFARK